MSHRLTVRTLYRDTVCSVGLIPRRLPFVASNTAIRYFRHALSLDERRAKFKANLYNRPTAKESKLGVQPGEMPTPTKEFGGTLNGVVAAGLLESVMSRQRAQSSDLEQTLTNKSITKETLKLLIELQEGMERVAKVNGPSIHGATVASSKQKAVPSRKPTVKSPRKQQTADDNSDEEDERYEYLYADDGVDAAGDASVSSQPSPNGKRPETDVLEVWFAGCHCGQYIVLEPDANLMP